MSVCDCIIAKTIFQISSPKFQISSKEMGRLKYLNIHNKLTSCISKTEVNSKEIYFSLCKALMKYTRRR